MMSQLNNMNREKCIATCTNGIFNEISHLHWLYTPVTY